MWVKVRLETLVVVTMVLCATVSARADDMEQVRKGALGNVVIALKNALIITQHEVKKCEGESAAGKRLRCFEELQLGDRLSMLNEAVSVLVEEVNRDAGRRN